MPKWGRLDQDPDDDERAIVEAVQSALRSVEHRCVTAREARALYHLSLLKSVYAGNADADTLRVIRKRLGIVLAENNIKQRFPLTLSEMVSCVFGEFGQHSRVASYTLLAFDALRRKKEAGLVDALNSLQALWQSEPDASRGRKIVRSARVGGRQKKNKNAKYYDGWRDSYRTLKLHSVRAKCSHIAEKHQEATRQTVHWTTIRNHVDPPPSKRGRAGKNP